MYSFFYLKKLQRNIEYSSLFSNNQKYRNTHITTEQNLFNFFQKEKKIFFQTSKNHQNCFKFLFSFVLFPFLKRIKKEKNTKKQQYWLSPYFSQLQNVLIQKKRILLTYFWKNNFFVQSSQGFQPFLFKNSKKKVSIFFEKINFFFIQEKLKRKCIFQNKKNQNEYNHKNWRFIVAQKVNFLCIDFLEEILFAFVSGKNFLQKQITNFLFSQNFSHKLLSLMIFNIGKPVHIQKKTNCHCRNFLSWQNFLKIFEKIITLLTDILFFKIWRFSHVSFFQKRNFQKISQKFKNFFSYCITLQWWKKKHLFLETMNFSTMLEQSFSSFSTTLWHIPNLGKQHFQDHSFPLTFLKKEKNFYLFDSCFVSFFSMHWKFFQKKQFRIDKIYTKQSIFGCSCFFLNFLESFCSPIFFHSQEIQKFQTQQNNFSKTNIFVFSDFLVFFQNFPLSLEFFVKKYRIFIFESFFFSFFQNFFLEDFNFLFFQNELKIFQHFLNNTFVFQNFLKIFLNNLFFQNSKNPLFSSNIKTILFTFLNNQKEKKKKFFLNFEKHVRCFFNQIHQKEFKNIFFHCGQQNFAFSLFSKIKLLVLKNKIFLRKQNLNFHVSLRCKETDWYIPLHILFFSLLKTTEINKIPLFFTIFVFSFLEKKRGQKKIQKLKNLNFEKSKKYFFKNFLGFKIFDVFLFFCFKNKKNIKNIFFFKTKPTRESIQYHLHECKQILQYSIASPQFKIMKKLQKKIHLWCNQYDNSVPTKKIFSYCDGILFRFLWNWAKRKHPNKSKDWIRKKYFHCLSNKKWFFAQKMGNEFICLQLHRTTKNKKEIFL